jgi:hypothetical protein
MRSSTLIRQVLAAFVMFSSVPTRISSGILQCAGFSLSSVGRSITSQSHQRIEELQKSQSKEDLLVSNWFSDQAGILGTSRICLSTSDKSVGGRGLFWVDDERAYQGDVLAFIPSRCVITAANLEAQFPGLQGMQESDASWQAKMTASASHCLKSPGNDYMNRVEWIKSWQGGGPSGPQPSEFYSTEELNQLGVAAESTVDVVEKKIDERYATFMHDFERMKKEKFYESSSAEFGELYSIAISRTACLGPIWHNQRGIIPVHDFVNHPPPSSRSNVELICFGDLRKMNGFVHANELLKRVKKDPNETTKNVYFEPKDDDVLLVASRDIQIGNELWLSYRDSQNIETDEEQIWLMLQYGFPLHL